MKFILNDENKLNQYGFRVRNSGLNLDRFRKNPVMLDSHKYGSVIGRWENIRIEDGLLTAEPVFDMDDPEAEKIAQKVLNGFLKGASLGLDPYKMSNFQTDLNGEMELVESEVLEASIVAIPANSNAVKLYAVTESGEKMMEESAVPEIMLMAKEINNYKNSEMKKIKLSALACMAIALNADVEHDVDVVNAGILDLKSKLDAALQKIEGFEQLEADKKAKLGADLVDSAIKSGKIPATDRKQYIELYAANPELAKSVIEKLPGKENLGGQVNTPAAVTDVKTVDDFEKLSLSAQLEFKNNNPEAYKQLFNS